MTSGTTSPPRRERARALAAEAAAWAGRHLPWGDVLAGALERERIAAAGLLAGGLAYRLFFWLVPLGLVFAAVASFWVEADRGGLESAARDFGIGGAAASAAADAIERDAHSRWYFLAAGSVLLLWFGGGVVRALHVAHAVAWRLRPGKVRRAPLGGAVFTALMVALLVAAAATAALREQAPGLGLLITLATTLLYAAVAVWGSRHLPSRATDWRSFVPGAILIAVGTLLVHVLVVFYLAPKLGRSSELYGTLGAATVVLLWLYLEARLVVAGAFLNAALWERSRPG